MSNFFVQDSWLSQRITLVKVASFFLRKLSSFSFTPLSPSSSRLTEMATRPFLALSLYNWTSCGNSLLQFTHQSAQKSMTITLPLNCLTVFASSGYLTTFSSTLSSARALAARAAKVITARAHAFKFDFIVPKLHRDIDQNAILIAHSL